MKNPDYQSRQPVFIVSTGRSGSTMISQVLAVHPSLCAFHEPHPHLRTEAFAKWADPSSYKAIERRIRRKRDDLISQIRLNRLIYVESSNYTSHLIEELHDIYQAKFVHLYRDGRNFVRSGLERDWYNQQPLQHLIKTWLRRRYLVDIGKTATDNLLNPPGNLRTRLEKIAWLWTETNRKILDSFSSLPDSSKFSFKLEKLCKDKIIDLLNFIGVDFQAELIDEMLEIASARPNKTKKPTIPSYIEWSEQEKNRFNNIAKDMMQTLGYTI